MAWNFWPFKRKKERRFARFYLTHNNMTALIEMEVVDESSKAYRLRWMTKEGRVLKDFWVLKNDPDLLDVDGEASVVLKKMDNVVILPPRKK